MQWKRNLRKWLAALPGCYKVKHNASPHRKDTSLYSSVVIPQTRDLCWIVIAAAAAVAVRLKWPPELLLHYLSKTPTLAQMIGWRVFEVMGKD